MCTPKRGIKSPWLPLPSGGAWGSRGAACRLVKCGPGGTPTGRGLLGRVSADKK